MNEHNIDEIYERAYEDESPLTPQERAWLIETGRSKSEYLDCAPVDLPILNDIELAYAVYWACYAYGMNQYGL